MRRARPSTVALLAFLAPDGARELKSALPHKARFDGSYIHYYAVGDRATKVHAGELKAYRIDRVTVKGGAYEDRYYSLIVVRIGSELVLSPHSGAYERESPWHLPHRPSR